MDAQIPRGVGRTDAADFAPRVAAQYRQASLSLCQVHVIPGVVNPFDEVD
jgi:hypothetical protein